MREKPLFILTAVILLCSFVAAALISLFSVSKLAADNQRETTRLLESQIYDDISSNLTAPIVVARAMSHNLYLQEALKSPSFPDTEEAENMLVDYLEQLRSSLGYTTAFIVSEDNRKYYTNNGFNKTIDVKTDGHDVWYPLFVSSGEKFDLDIDTDQANQDLWTIFINCRIEDEEGNLLGVCGVGIGMETIQKRLAYYENKYDLEINLVDTKGHVQVDTDSVHIESALLEEAVANYNPAQEYSYMRTDSGGFIVTKYVPNFNWYLVVSRESHDTSVYLDLILRLVLASVLICFVAIAALTALLRKDRKRLVEKANHDTLTGVLTRSAFLKGVERACENDKAMPAAFVFLDLDNFKTLNDLLGHTVGDEAISDAAQSIASIFRNDDLVGRFGGDEFVLFVKNIPLHTLNTRLSELQEELRRTYQEDDKEAFVSASMGVVYGSKLNELSSQRMLQLADEQLYKAKDAGRNQYALLNLDETAIENAE